ncbi:ATP-binding protein [Agromyces endophyticus]|uniref:AlbA family DNA-binding domain-containing protein n=1 Tax=Agromyces sp. H17E-10 TaxID=2932244 RepID=UPI001FD12B28|nr:ATP-binding protein [Agromyces sp. H17E-10]UOQ88716.1 ATP-binding protein [Agromyces sp. H17E-10]
MLHTPLHRALGERPGPLTDQMIDDAVAQGIGENDELDWKTALPPEKEFRESDIVKDIAAFANAGGGIIVFGVSETNKAAGGRHDAGELTEGYERTIRRVTMAAITPPVFGVEVVAIPSTTGARAVALLIPASPDGPHLVYRNDQFGAPLRTGADTHWMKERELEAAYRSRFEGARRGEEALHQIYDDIAAAADPSDRAVLVGAARPRSRRPRSEPLESVASTVDRAQLVTRWWLGGLKYSPLEDVEMYQARPTLGGQYLPPKSPNDYREAHAVLLDDGSVGLSWRAGGHERDKSGRHHEPHQIPTLAVDAFAAALVALIHAVAGESPAGDYDVILGVEAAMPPEFHDRNAAPPSGVHRSLSGRFRPVRVTVDPSVNDTQFISAAIDVATLALNQVGIKKPTNLDTMLPPRPANWTW